MPSKPKRPAPLRFLLDEHYPAWLATDLTGEGLDTLAVVGDSELRGLDDAAVLTFDAADRRVVVTEDVTTFSAAIALVPEHVGVIYCHHARFPRNPAGLKRLHTALSALAHDPPPGQGVDPVIWWLEQQAL